MRQPTGNHIVSPMITQKNYPARCLPSARNNIPPAQPNKAPTTPPIKTLCHAVKPIIATSTALTTIRTTATNPYTTALRSNISLITHHPSQTTKPYPHHHTPPPTHNPIQANNKPSTTHGQYPTQGRTKKRRHTRNKQENKANTENSRYPTNHSMNEETPHRGENQIPATP